MIIGSFLLKMKNILGIKSTCVFLTFGFGLAIISIIATAQYASKSNHIRVVFYNVENLFDTVNDSLKLDDDFTPSGANRWTEYKLNEKLQRIAKVLIAIGEWQLPAIVGLCEVENAFVLESLIKNTALKHGNYGILHFESPDVRGIDVALLYNQDIVSLLTTKAFQPDVSSFSSRPTRDILYAKVLINNKDTLNLFINHWPSRYGGQLASENGRIIAATLLKNLADSLLHLNKDSNIMIMGDFNDEPADRSLKETLAACDLDAYQPACNLLNLMPLHSHAQHGTLHYTGTVPRWYTFDQIIVSRALLNGDFIIKDRKANIFKPDWLLDKNKEKPFRTFQGPAYIGGFSDHLPVYTDIEIR